MKSQDGLGDKIFILSHECGCVKESALVVQPSPASGLSNTSFHCSRHARYFEGEEFNLVDRHLLAMSLALYL